MRREHAQAVLGLIDGDNTTPALNVQDGRVDRDVVPPYVLPYFAFSWPTAAERPDATDLSFDQLALTMTATIHSVAGSAAAARSIADRVAATLLNVTPTVAGRSCTPIRCVDGQPGQRDETDLTAVFDVVDVYEFTSHPAS